MKKTIKNAFTLVELLVVIAILAILTTIGIVTYRSQVEKGYESDDNTMVAQLNRYAQTYLVSNDINCVSDVANVIEADGIELSKITNKVNDNVFGFDISSSKFFRIDKTTGDPINYTITNKIDGFAFAKSSEDITLLTGFGYSVYLQEGDYNSSITINKGIDVGVNTEIVSINYINSDAQSATIYTNYQEITVNSSNDTVNHYGFAAIVNCNDVKVGTYNEYGIVGRLIYNDEQGAIKFKNGCTVYCYMNITDDDSCDVSSTTKENTATVYTNVSSEEANEAAIDENARVKNDANGSLTVDLDEEGKTIVKQCHNHVESYDIIESEGYKYIICKCCGAISKYNSNNRTVVTTLSNDLNNPDLGISEDNLFTAFPQPRGLVFAVLDNNAYVLNYSEDNSTVTVYEVVKVDQSNPSLGTGVTSKITKKTTYPNATKVLAISGEYTIENNIVSPAVSTLNLVQEDVLASTYETFYSSAAKCKATLSTADTYLTTIEWCAGNLASGGAEHWSSTATNEAPASTGGYYEVLLSDETIANAWGERIFYSKYVIDYIS